MRRFPSTPPSGSAPITFRSTKKTGKFSAWKVQNSLGFIYFSNWNICMNKISTILNDYQYVHCYVHIPTLRWPWHLNALQLKNSHANTQNTSKLRHLQFDNTRSAFRSLTANSLQTQHVTLCCWVYCAPCFCHVLCGPNLHVWLVDYLSILTCTATVKSTVLKWDFHQQIWLRWHLLPLALLTGCLMTWVVITLVPDDSRCHWPHCSHRILHEHVGAQRYRTENVCICGKLVLSNNSKADFKCRICALNTMHYLSNKPLEAVVDRDFSLNVSKCFYKAGAKTIDYLVRLKNVYTQQHCMRSSI